MLNNVSLHTRKVHKHLAKNIEDILNMIQLRLNNCYSQKQQKASATYNQSRAFTAPYSALVYSSSLI